MTFVEENILKWQDEFNEKEKDGIEQYKKGIILINGKEHLIVKGNEPKFKHDLKSSRFNVQYQNIFKMSPPVKVLVKC